MHNQATAEAAVHLDVEEGIGTLTIDRPQVLNALSRNVLLELDQAIARLSADAEVRGVIVTGAGPKAFVAGADIQELDRLDGASGYDAARFGQSIFRRLELMPKPSAMCAHLSAGPMPPTSQTPVRIMSQAPLDAHSARVQYLPSMDSGPRMLSLGRLPDSHW